MQIEVFSPMCFVVSVNAVVFGSLAGGFVYTEMSDPFDTKDVPACSGAFTGANLSGGSTGGPPPPIPVERCSEPPEDACEIGCKTYGADSKRIYPSYFRRCDPILTDCILKECEVRMYVGNQNCYGDYVGADQERYSCDWPYPTGG